MKAYESSGDQADFEFWAKRLERFEQSLGSFGSLRRRAEYYTIITKGNLETIVAVTFPGIVAVPYYSNSSTGVTDRAADFVGQSGRLTAAHQEPAVRNV